MAHRLGWTGMLDGRFRRPPGSGGYGEISHSEKMRIVLIALSTI